MCRRRHAPTAWRMSARQPGIHPVNGRILWLEPPWHQRQRKVRRVICPNTVIVRCPRTLMHMHILLLILGLPDARQSFHPQICVIFLVAFRSASLLHLVGSTAGYPRRRGATRFCSRGHASWNISTANHCSRWANGIMPYRHLKHTPWHTLVGYARL